LTGRSCSAIEDVRAALDDDLNTPGALAALDEAAQGGHNVEPGAALLGITL
jgi:L-cysteine:1D-myo-inositol 2-amino-2-deoxy-alpha-D-glucopyranoside ligase